jgi:hypothetical protein
VTQSGGSVWDASGAVGGGGTYAVLTLPIPTGPTLLPMTLRHLLGSVLLLLTSALPAQYFLSVGSEARQSARATWLGRSGEQSVVVDYGQPQWRPAYEAVVVQLAALPTLLGKGAPTTLRTDVALAFGAQTLPRGRWYAGVRRDERQEWCLVLFDADKADATGRGTTGLHAGEPDLRVPMRFSREDAVEDRFEITLRDDKRTPRSLTLGIAFGPFRVATEVVPDFDDRKPDGMPEFAMTAPGKGTRTASGLVYEVLREGTGARPAADATVRAHFTGWLTDGTVFDSTLVRGAPEPLRAEWVVKGLWEGLQTMQPGAVWRLTIPAELGAGAQGMGNRVPPNAVLVYVVEMVGIGMR